MGDNSFQSYLEALHGDFVKLRSGAVASYIPELLKADPDWFGIALVTVDGHVYQAGDSRQAFTIQSISKAITYGIALEDQGIDAVMRKVDVEPSGEAFNSISLEPGTGRPRNPMINAGAIATVALIKGDSPEEKFERMLACYERYLGRRVQLDDEVYHSEKSTGHRNRAIAYLLHNSNILERTPDDTLDVYFKQCSLLVTCRDLAVIGATLANDGVNPITGVRALRSPYVAKVLSVMMSCGMYDYSGAWMYEVGMPAKSGVGGGIVAVLPGQFGLAVFSPPLDDRGNSARGIAVCRKISADYSLHTLHTGSASVSSVVHATYDASQVSSKRARNATQLAALAERGTRAMVLELQGDLVFASTEIVIREAKRLTVSADYLVLDFARVGLIGEGALNLLGTLVQALYEQGRTVLLTGISNKYLVARTLKARVGAIDSGAMLACEDVDHALEWCEDRLLNGDGAFAADEAPLSDQLFCAGFDGEELATLQALLERRHYAAAEVLCREGEPADSLFFILAGEVSVNVPLAYQRQGRISTLGPGTAVGEMAMLDRGKRSADIVADTDVTCLVLDYARLAAAPGVVGERVRLKLVTNIARALTRKLRQATLEIKLLRN
ncbi:MAG: glutaminase A [Gammaproteobacteria bacterium]|nr:glutaminase A [Gammaproteobacteria bacterium]